MSKLHIFLSTISRMIVQQYFRSIPKTEFSKRSYHYFYDNSENLSNTIPLSFGSLLFLKTPFITTLKTKIQEPKVMSKEISRRRYQNKGMVRDFCRTIFLIPRLKKMYRDLICFVQSGSSEWFRTNTHVPKKASAI